MKPEVVTLYNPLALEMPELRNELDNNWTNSAGWKYELAQRMGKGLAAVVAGTSDPLSIEGLAIVALPEHFGEEMPWVVHFHNRGPRDLTHSMVQAVVDFVKLAGYNGYKALNQSGRSDKAWLRAFKTAGNPVFIGSAYFFDLTGENNGSGNTIRGDGAGDRRKSAGRRGRPKAEKHLDPDRHDKARVSNAGKSSDRGTWKRSRGRPKRTNPV